MRFKGAPDAVGSPHLQGEEVKSLWGKGECCQTSILAGGRNLGSRGRLRAAASPAIYSASDLQAVALGGLTTTARFGMNTPIAH